MNSRVAASWKSEASLTHSCVAASDRCARIERHHAALEQYRARDWDAAESAFRKLAGGEPEVRLFALYLERIEQYRRNPPAPEWNGIFTFDEK